MQTAVSGRLIVTYSGSRPRKKNDGHSGNRPHFGAVLQRSQSHDLRVLRHRPHISTILFTGLKHSVFQQIILLCDQTINLVRRVD